MNELNLTKSEVLVLYNILKFRIQDTKGCIKELQNIQLYTEELEIYYEDLKNIKNKFHKYIKANMEDLS